MPHLRIATVIASSLALAACAPVPPSPAPPAPTSAVAVSSAPNPSVGGAPMLTDRTVVQNAAAAPNLSTLVRAVNAAGLAPALSAPGPITVFAPTDEAFGRLAPGTLELLLRPQNRASLAKVLNYHVIPGDLSAAQIRRRVAAEGGVVNLVTASGDVLAARVENGALTLTDQGGNRSYVETADVRQSNGVVHVVNGVLVPTLP